MNFPNSNGFQYEAAAVADAISKGLTEAPEWTLDETMNMMREMDDIREQVGVVYPAAPAAKVEAPATRRPATAKPDWWG